MDHVTWITTASGYDPRNVHTWSAYVGPVRVRLTSWCGAWRVDVASTRTAQERRIHDAVYPDREDAVADCMRQLELLAPGRATERAQAEPSLEWPLRRSLSEVA